MNDDRSMDSPQISRSGRVLKKSAKVKEMEDFDINEIDVQGKPRKKLKTVDDFDEYDDKRVAPIKIPKISLSMQGATKRKVDTASPVGKPTFKTSFQNTAKAKQDARRNIYHDSSEDSKESDSSSVSSESSSSSPSSSEASDDEEAYHSEYRNERKAVSVQALSVHRDSKVIVEQQQQQYEPANTYIEQSSGASTDDSEDAASDSALVIAEDSEEETYATKNQKGIAKKRGGKKDPSYAPRQGGARRKTPAKITETAVARKKKPATAKAKPLSAYMLWCTENRKKIAASSGNIGFGNIGKKMGEAWQALPEKEKMAWRRKAKRLTLKSPGNIINTGPSNSTPIKASSRTNTNLNDEIIKGSSETGVLGTAPIDAAAHLKLLGDSLTVIGQRLIEHEGQLAVSGIYSVLLDTLLCAIAPLLCLSSEITGLNNVPPETFRKTLDHIAYFMPGL